MLTEESKEMFKISALQQRELVSIDYFMNLSADINYLLGSNKPTKQTLDSLVALVLGPVYGILEYDNKVYRGAIECLLLGYGRRKRKMGTPSIIHPLRTAAILARGIPNPSSLHILAALLHDKPEDIDKKPLSTIRRKLINEKFKTILETIGANEAWYLGERLDPLTREGKRSPTDIEQSYTDYIRKILKISEGMRDLLHVKLADRLDNTLDSHTTRPGAARFNFYKTIFDILFVPVFDQVQINLYHFFPTVEEGVILLSQLYKNSLMLSMIRMEQLDKSADDPSTKILFDALVIASLREAQWIALELFAIKINDCRQQRNLLMKIMEYCQKGGILEIREESESGLLDGTLVKFASSDRHKRHESLIYIYENPDLLASVLISFIATFACFLNDQSFYIRGIGN